MICLVVSVEDRDRSRASYWYQNGTISILINLNRGQIFNTGDYSKVSDILLIVGLSFKFYCFKYTLSLIVLLEYIIVPSNHLI